MATPAWDYSTYLPWLQGAYAQGGRYSAQGPSRIGGSTAMHGMGGYTYTPGQSNADFVRDNSTRDFTSGVTPAAVATPSGGALQVARAYRGYKAYKDTRDKERQRQMLMEREFERTRQSLPSQYLATFDPTSQTAQASRQALANGQPLEAEQLASMLGNEKAQNARDAMSAQIDEFFSDPARAGWQQDVVQRRLNLDLSNISKDYEDNRVSAAQHTAGQGLLGGSVDAERMAANEGARDTATVSAASRADAAKADFKDRDQATRQQLLGLVNSGGPADAGGLSAALQGVADSSRREGEEFAIGQQQRQQQAFEGQQRSQLYGQGIQVLTGLIRQDPNRASSWGAWTGRTPSTSTGGW